MWPFIFQTTMNAKAFPVVMEVHVRTVLVDTPVSVYPVILASTVKSVSSYDIYISIFLIVRSQLFYSC